MIAQAITALLAHLATAAVAPMPEDIKAAMETTALGASSSSEGGRGADATTTTRTRTSTRRPIAGYNHSVVSAAVMQLLVPAMQAYAQSHGHQLIVTAADHVGIELKKHLYAVMSTSTIEDDALFARLYDILDVAMCMGLDTTSGNNVDPSLQMTLIEDMIDVLTLDGTARIFDYIESRKTLLTKDMDANKGKGLVFLRFCNELLRRLSKTKNTFFCGRILIFITSAFPLTERSGVNLRGDFNVENVTYYEEIEPEKPAADPVPDASAMETTTVKADPGPDSMDVDVTAPVAAPPEQKGIDIASDPHFYSEFWVLQKFLSNPLLLSQDPNWLAFKQGVERVLKVFDAINEEVNALSPATLKESRDRDRKRKERSTSDKRVISSSAVVGEEVSNVWFFPKYLSSRSLFQLELRDPYFRRQILVQFLIIFQFLLVYSKKELDAVTAAAAAAAANPTNPTPGVPAVAPKPVDLKPAIQNKSLQFGISISEEQETWITETRSRMMKTLEVIAPFGKRFSNTLTTVITHEKNWIRWKGESCQSFEKEHVSFENKKRRKLESSLAIRKGYLGSDELTKLWAIGEEPAKVLADSKDEVAVVPLEKFLEPLADQLNPDFTVAAEIDEEYLLCKDKRYNWRAYRTALKNHVNLYQGLNSIDTLELLKRLKAPPPVVTGTTAPPPIVVVTTPVAPQTGTGTPTTATTPGLPSVTLPPPTQQPPPQPPQQQPQHLQQQPSKQQQQQLSALPPPLTSVQSSSSSSLS